MTMRLSREYELRLLDHCDVLMAQVDTNLAALRDLTAKPLPGVRAEVEAELYPLRSVGPIRDDPGRMTLILTHTTTGTIWHVPVPGEPVGRRRRALID